MNLSGSVYLWVDTHAQKVNYFFNKNNMKKILLFSMGLFSAVLLLAATADAFTITGGSMTRSSTDGRARVNTICERVNGRLSMSFLCTGDSDSSSGFPTFGTCGNGIVELTEECDGTAPEGYMCSAQCKLVEVDDSSDQTNTDEPQCGNQIVEAGEECDGSAPEGYACTSSCLLHDISILGNGVVINEVYADVDSYRGIAPNNQWLELYNSGDQIVDLFEWSIVDNSGQKLVVSKHIELAPGEFAVVVVSASTHNIYWQLPESAKLVAFGGIFGDALQTTGDSLALYNNDHVLIDALSYGTDTSIFSLGKAAAGDSLARIAPGVDTNSPEDWVRLDQPTPGF